MQALRTQLRHHHLAVAVVVSLLFSLGGIAAGCAEESAVEPTVTAPATETTARPAAVPTTAYFPDSTGEGIVKTVVSGTQGTGLDAAMGALVAGPDRASLVPALPAETRLLSASVDGAVARVDFSEDFATGYPAGGSAAEIAVLAPIVFTATEIAGVESVLVLVDGKTPEVPTQFDLATPLGRDDFPPQIVVAAP